MVDANTSLAQVMGDFDGMDNQSTRLQGISDQQGIIMRNLGQTMENLAVHMQGQAGTAMQQLGDRLQAIGNKFSAQFGDQANLMHNNVQLMNAHEEDNINIIRQVQGLTG